MIRTNFKIAYFIPLIVYPIWILLQHINVLPYHRSWDSSLLYATDTLLNNGGLMPGHLFHPDAGVLWFEKFFVFPFAKFFNIISISTMQELQASSNPYLNFVDVVIFLLRMRASYVYITSSVLYVAFLKLYEDHIDDFPTIKKFLIAFCTALCCYHFLNILYGGTRVVRYEFGATLLTSLMFLSMILSVRTNQKRYIILMGIFGGWAFLCKIIALPSAILIVLAYYILHSSYYTDFSVTEKEKKQNLVLSIILWILILATNIFIATVLLRKTLHYTNFVYHLRIQHVLGLFLIFPMAAFIICSMSMYFNKKSIHKASYYFHRLVIFVLSFFSPIFVLLFQNKGTHIFSNVYIFSFGLGQIGMSLVSGYNNPSERYLGRLRILFYGVGIIVLGLIALYLFYKKQKEKMPFAMSIMLVGSTLILNTLFLRGDEARLPSFNVFMSLVIMLVVFYRLFKIKYPIIFFVLFGIVYQSNMFYKKFLYIPIQGGHSYTYSLNEWFSWNYGTGDTPCYPQALQKSYHTIENWQKAFYWARDVTTVKQLLNTSQGNPNKLQDSAITFLGASLPHHKETLSNISPQIEGALILPVINDGSIYLREDYHTYIVTEEEIDTGQYPQAHATDLVFQTDTNDYYVYQIPSAINYQDDIYRFTAEQQIKYIIFVDYLAKSL